MILPMLIERRYGSLLRVAPEKVNELLILFFRKCRRNRKMLFTVEFNDDPARSKLCCRKLVAVLEKTRFSGEDGVVTT
jgi:hypothetical protein